MQDYDFYKSKFNRELSRRNDLDNAINNPILGITIIIGLVSYIITNHNFFCWYLIDYVVLIILMVSVLVSVIALFYIFKSSNNLFIGFDYPNFGSLKGYREFQKSLVTYNEGKQDCDKKFFETEIIDKIIDYADEHTEINDKRALYIHFSRKYIVIAFILTIINLILITINNFIDYV